MNGCHLIYFVDIDEALVGVDNLLDVDHLVGYMGERVATVEVSI